LNKKILVLIIFVIISQVYGQPIKNKFTHFTEKNGLSSNVVNCIMQDHLGYIWIGTSNGVARYDGYEFKNFTVVPKDTNFLQLPLTISLYEDSKGNVWIGSVEGVTKYDRSKNTFTLFSFSQLQQKYNREFVANYMQEMTDGNILCSVYDYHYLSIKNGLFLIDTKIKKVKEINISNDDSTDALIQIVPLENDKYLISGVKGIAEYDYNKNFIKWYPFNKPILVFTFLKDGNNNLWLGTYHNGLIYYNVKDSTYKDFSVFNDLLSKYKNLSIFKIIYDQKKNIYLATNYGLMYFNVKTKELSVSEINPQNPSALHSPNINDILLDNSGSIWIANNDAGISKYDIVKNNFQAYTAKVDDKNSITPGWVSTIFEYNENELWLKSAIGTIVKFNPQTETFKREPLPKNFELYHVLRTSKGKILLAGSNGFYTVDPINWKFERLKLPVNMSNDLVFTAIEVDKKTIWFGTVTGLYIYDEINGATTHIDFRTLGIGDNTSNSVTILLEDKNKNIWIGTNNGLFKYDAETKLYSRIGFSKDHSKSLTAQDINSLYVDNDNNLWIGTWLGGLNTYNQKSGKFESYTQKDGLPSHSVQGILGDEENGYLWLSTFNGISRFDLKKKTFSNFGVDDGIHANQFADGSALKTSKGLFVFGGSNGITVFNPKEIQNNLIPPQVEITDFKLFSKSVLPGKNSLLKKPIYDTKNLILNYNENDIEFDYFAAHYVDPQKNQYAYKLENYEDDWRYVGNQRSAIYPNLPPGKYIFHVKASNNNDVWNEKGASIYITILPPWWKTWWAYIIYFFAFVGILGGIRKFELDRRKEKENQRILQLENDRKTKELEGARQLQLSMLPKELPKLQNYDIAVYMKTATEVGGDYYDFNVGADGTLTVVIGDATGHGMKAGTIVSMVKALFSSGGSRLDLKTYFDQSSEALKEIELGR
jgi:ligand-binding sensor domain-containing protein